MARVPGRTSSSPSTTPQCGPCSVSRLASFIVTPLGLAGRDTRQRWCCHNVCPQSSPGGRDRDRRRNGQVSTSSKRLEINYCRRCRFVLRATWLAQELLFSLGDQLTEVALKPGQDGIFSVVLDGETLFDRRSEGRFPEPKEIKQAVRDRLAPEMDLGHSDRTHP
ncbi:SelT/SelW/SelH family protein [Ectothiorhodospiraceae bacterium WFHF3C12]|nr:SelT/SelW/SelH family protein [Ectothiorhodospiraceae bacterium WFHF3C12]